MSKAHFYVRATFCNTVIHAHVHAAWPALRTAAYLTDPIIHSQFFFPSHLTFLATHTEPWRAQLHARALYICDISVRSERQKERTRARARTKCSGAVIIDVVIVVIFWTASRIRSVCVHIYIYIYNTYIP